MEELLYINKIPEYVRTEFSDKVRSIANLLNIKDANWLMILFNAETAGKMKPDTTNNIGSVGFIQFTSDLNTKGYKKIGNKTYKLTDIAKMGYVEQLELVYLYYKQFNKSSINSFYDLYLLTFYPFAFGKPDTYIYGSEKSDAYAQTVAKQNPAISKGKLYITNVEFREYTNSKLKAIGITDKIISTLYEATKRNAPLLLILLLLTTSILIYRKYV